MSYLMAYTVKCVFVEVGAHWGKSTPESVPRLVIGCVADTLYNCCLPVSVGWQLSYRSLIILGFLKT